MARLASRDHTSGRRLPVRSPPLGRTLSSPHRIFADFVCPLVSRSERRIVELRILFFHSIWKLSRRRRFSSQPLGPITESELEELRGSIQGCTGRLASL
ncbi:BQ2448_5858 [Microbotryum intermedium]|uniref:BQ2448_5858 protein n=1 Tax=Microbotryum intermedium TaxID=269621 RepID=A0A238EZD4_9BASI|nr:BQ2448_5858 [Microbotryum intermedium]